MPVRLADLLAAIVGEPDPAVRGRAAALLIRDLAAATAAAKDVLAAAEHELASSGRSPAEIERLLSVADEPPSD